jgi:hypothetical protein
MRSASKPVSASTNTWRNTVARDDEDGDHDGEHHGRGYGKGKKHDQLISAGVVAPFSCRSYTVGAVTLTAPLLFRSWALSLSP